MSATQQTYHFELDGGATYRAELADPATTGFSGLAYHIYNAAGQRLARPLLAPEISAAEVEIYLLCWVVNWDMRLHRPATKR